MKQQKILVTGANGFLAANVVRELLHRGYEVRGMVREHANLVSLNGISIELFRGNITNRQDVEKAVDGCRVVIHVAADTSQRFETAAPLMKANVEATRFCIEACKKFAIGRFIFISTGNTIDFGTLDNPGHEGNPPGRLFLKSGYALSKLLAEKMVIDSVKKEGLNAVIMNPAFMIGPHDAKPSSGRILKMMYPRSIVFIPKGGKNFVDVKAAASAICNAITMGKPGERYLLAGVNLTYLQFLKIVREGLKTFPVLIPDWVLIGMGAAGLLLRKLGIPSELSVDNARILCSKDYYSNRKAVAELEMPETDIKKAVGEAINWMNVNGLL